MLVHVLRAESILLKQHVEAQDKELTERMRRIEELQEKERVANENVNDLGVIIDCCFVSSFLLAALFFPVKIFSDEYIICGPIKTTNGIIMHSYLYVTCRLKGL